MTKRSRAAACALLAACLVGVRQLRAQSPQTTGPVPLADARPIVLTTSAGRFEIIALDHAAAQVAVTIAGNVWGTLRDPLGLPARFSSAIVVRLLPGARWQEATPFRTVVETGGVVTVLLGLNDDLDENLLRRALVQGLIMRQAVVLHAVSNRLTAPLWLEHACVSWSLTRERPSLHDAWVHDAAQVSPPALRELLNWSREDGEHRAREVAAPALLGHLMGESSRAGGWPAMRAAILGGRDGLAALTDAYRGLPANEAEQECWWQVGYFHQQASQAQPMRTAAESREWLAELFRVVLAKTERDVVLSLEDLFVARLDPVVANEREQRIARLAGEAAQLHPFYRNAALSLGRTLVAIRTGNVQEFALTRTEFTRDLLDGRELEDASKALLDESEP